MDFLENECIYESSYVVKEDMLTNMLQNIP